MNCHKREIFKEEKKKIDNKYDKQYKDEVIKCKISFSEKKNEANLSKINKKNTLIKEIVNDTEQKLIEFASSKNETYKNLLKSLIVQGMTQMLENECIIRIRKQDESIVNQIIPICEEEYSKIMKDTTGREFKTSLNIDHNNYLESKLGGVHLFDKTMTIQCCNDLESRLELSYNKLLPKIKELAFKK